MPLIAPMPQPFQRATLGLDLATTAYLRERTAPSLRDQNYLCLSDLRRLVLEFANSARGRVFDYGCGGAPYREYFGRCDAYIGADVTSGPRVDRILSGNGLTEEPAGGYQAVFSSQVLEHVKDPAAYLRECWRILEPGGLLFLSTHGLFIEHGCPFDFWRWTPAGLEEQVRAAGLSVVRSHKLTTEFRGILQMQHYFVEGLRAAEDSLARYPLALFRRFYRWLCLPLMNWLGDWFPGQGVVSGSHPAALYVVICVVAQKPNS